MSTREDYPAGVPCWVDLLVPDPPATMRFLSGVSDWDFVGPGPMPGDGGGYWVARKNGRDVAGVGSLPPGAPPHAAWTTYVAVESAEAAVDGAVAAGGSVVAPVFDALPAGRGAVITDPTGAVIGVWEPRERRGAEVINEPSAWAMSLLQTTDTGTAARFYAEVFGWQADTIDLDGVALTLFRLPGYVGGEPEQPVPRDMVAGMLPLPPEASGAGVPPHWAVDFWIADADAAAAVTPSLGGRVLAEPHNTPPFRRAVLAEPHGAAFSVSTLVLAS
jgi:uncharacterized protein